MSRLPSVTGVQLISDEVLEILKAHGDGALHPDQKIAMAALLFADAEGVAYVHDGALARWCSLAEGQMSSKAFIQRRIGVLVDAGVLAPGSTATELRSMIARRAVVLEVESEAA